MTNLTNQEIIGKIEELLLTRKFSATQIARKLGRTKGSISGLIWRTPRLKEIGLPNAPGLSPRWKKKHEVIYLDIGPGPLTSLGMNHCKFPLWSHNAGPDEPRLFCRETKLATSSYCAKHHRLCVNIPPQGQQKIKKAG